MFRDYIKLVLEAKEWVIDTGIADGLTDKQLNLIVSFVSTMMLIPYMVLETVYTIKTFIETIL